MFVAMGRRKGGKRWVEGEANVTMMTTTATTCSSMHVRSLESTCRTCSHPPPHSAHSPYPQVHPPQAPQELLGEDFTGLPPPVIAPSLTGPNTSSSQIFMPLRTPRRTVGG